MQMKTNKNGVKLLAAVMVFAMAFAGAIVLFDSDDSSADIADSDVVKIGNNGYKDLASALEAAKENDTITALKNVPVNKEAIKVSITIDVGTFSLIMASDSSITINKDIAVKITNSSSSARGLIYYDYGSKIVLSEGSSLTIEHNGSPSALVNEPDNAGHVDGPLTIDMTKASLTFSKDKSTQALYIKAVNSIIDAKAIKEKTFGGAYLDLSNTTLTTGKLDIYSANLSGAKTVINADHTTIYGGNKTPSSLLTGVENVGTIFLTNTITLDSDAILNAGELSKKYGSAVATLTGAGTVNANITLDAEDKTNGFKFSTSITYNGNISSGTNVASFSGIKADAKDTNAFTVKSGSISINGEPKTADASGKIVVSSGEALITGTIDEGVTLVIEESAIVKTGSEIVNKGTIEVYGTIQTSTTLNNQAKMVITPTSKVETTITSAVGSSIVQDASMEKPFYIGGELDVSMPIGNATLQDSLHIPEGKTLTVTGDLFLNGGKITVDGELIINKGASIYDITENGMIVIGKGTISNNGVIGNAKAITIYYGGEETTIKAVKMQGVSGVNFEIKKLDGDNKIVVYGDISRITSVEKNELTVINAYIGNMNTDKKVTLVIEGDAVKSIPGATIVVDGEIKSSSDGEKNLTMRMNSTFTLNGYTNGKITVLAETGHLTDSTTIESVKNVGIKVGTNTTGFTIYTKKVAVTGTTSTEYYIRAYVNGSLTVVDKNGTEGSAAISEEFYIASGEKLGIGEKVAVTTGTNFNAIVQGTIIVDGKDSDIFSKKYVGASYSITVKDGTTVKSKTLYYTTFDAAIASISEADSKTVNSTITKIESDFTVAADQIVEFNAAKVASKNTVTVESDGTVKGITTVEGKVVVKDGATCSIPSTGYAAKTVSADNTITYAGLKIAIENATSGDVITISSGETSESLTIPAGVTVTVSNNLKVKGDLTVSEGAALIIKGTLTMTSTDKAVTTDVIGTLDVSDGTYVQGTKATLKSTGTTILQTTADVEFNGAYYNDSNGNTVITTVSKAVAGAASVGEDTVTINGTVSDSTEITLKDMTLALAEGAIVKLGTVKLENSTVDADATDAKLTATVVGMNGDADKAVSSSVKTSESNIVIVQTSTVKADETVSNKFTISGVSGTVTVASGNVKFASGVEIANGSKDKLVVSEGATLTLDNDMTVDGGAVVIDGTVDVVGKKLTLNNDKAKINGTVNVTKNGEVVLKKALVNGTIDVKTEKDKTNKLTISTEKFAFGKPIESIGASAVIIGNVDIPTNGSIVAYPGVDLSQAVFNADIDGKSTAVTTTYTINGVEYATVYALENNTVEVSSIFTPEQVKKVAGLDFTGITELTWKNVQGETANTAKIGEVDTVGIDVPVAKKKITVSVGTGISLYIDGIKYASGSEPSLTVGEHKVTATVNPGYKGTVDIMVNGVKITNGVFTVALDVDTVVSATGDITIDSGETPVTPVQPTEKDDGMGITDYLLIVLVVLAAILVVIVAIRMMRS